MIVIGGPMNAIPWILAGTVAVGGGAVYALASAAPHTHTPAERPRAPRPELEYLQAINLQGPPKDPQLLFLLMADYANANRHREGAEFLDARRKAFDAQLSDTQRALYLTASAALRAGAAHEIPLLHRIAWV